MTDKPHRNLRPSKATVAGPGSAVALTPLIVAALGAAGIQVTAELAAAMGPAIAFVVSWLTRGGRVGEPQ